MLDQVKNYWLRFVEESGAAWNRFWFAPSRPVGISLARAGLGFALFLYWCSFLPDPLLWFGGEGLLPIRSWTIGSGSNVETVYRFSLFLLSENPVYLWLLTLIGIGSSIAVMVGFGGRISLATAWIMTLSAVHRVPMFTGLAEPLMTMALPYLLIGNASGRFSVDRWLRIRSGHVVPPEATSLNTLSARLLQLHLLFFYLVMATTQMRFATWWDGLAAWTMMAGTERDLLDLSFLAPFTFLINALTYGIVIGEWAFIVLVWNRLARPLVIAGSACFWALMLIMSGMVEFSILMFVLGLVFVDEEFWEPMSARRSTHGSPAI